MQGEHKGPIEAIRADLVIEIYRSSGGEDLRAFRAVEEVINGLNSLAAHLIPSAAGIETEAILEHSSSRALTTWLRWRPNPTEAPAGDRSAFPQILSSVVVATFRWLNGVDRRSRIETLVDEITGIFAQIACAPCTPTRENLLRVVEQFRLAVSLLEESDRAELRTANDCVQLGRSAIRVDELRQSLSDVVTTNVLDLLLSVEVIDFEGGTRWVLRHGEDRFAAVISDEQWLNRFLARQLDVRPGDLMRATVEQRCYYTDCGGIVSKDHKILFISDVAAPPVSTTRDLVRSEARLASVA